jgi:ADP-dependent NAD(P)H-hydrate dehydratase / NAD(P)H-hydrate epimerase
MTELLTAAQMRAIEEAAIASGEVTGLELMERAGRGVVEAIFEEWPELKATSHRAVVLCGPGNNGGDGFVVARLLKERGWDVDLFLHGKTDRLPSDARVNYERWRTTGKIRHFEEDLYLKAGRAADVYVDAVFGGGISRPLDRDVWYIFAYMAGLHGDRAGFVPRTVAIDAPSGLCLSSGRFVESKHQQHMLNAAAALTVTFEFPKVGHYLAEGPFACGRIVVKEIGKDLSRATQQSVLQKQLDNGRHGPRDERNPILSPKVKLLPHSVQPAPRNRSIGLSLPEKRERGPRLDPQPTYHKYTYGHALILSGPSGRGGAARLAARGSLRIGAGVVTVGCPPEAIPENAARLDSVMLRGVADGEALAELLEDKRINALFLGPGMGVGAREAGLLAVALRGGGKFAHVRRGAWAHCPPYKGRP